MVVSRIKEIAARYPDRVAYQIEDSTITYAELLVDAESKARYLEKSVSKSVIIYGGKEINVVKSILACLIARKTYVPVKVGTPMPRLEQIISQSQAELVISDENIEIANVNSIQFDNLSYVENMLNVTSKNNDDIAYIIFTSGSTGKPKGVPITYANLWNFVKWISSLKPLDKYEKIKVLNQAYFSFDLSVADFYYSLCNGHSVVALDKDISNDYDEVFDILKTVDMAVITPSFLKACLLDRDFNESNFFMLKCVYLCGEILEKKTASKMLTAFPHIHMINAYGPTEATSAISAIEITPEMITGEDILPVGDMDYLATDVEIIENEIVLKGKSVFGGYLGDIKGGYYSENGCNCFNTGDIGWIENKKLYCNGRKDNQIKFMGYRIELGEIEKNILELNGVEDCVVLAERNAEGVTKRLKAYIVGDVGCDRVFNSLSEKLPAYMIPKVIKTIEQIPLNENGKIDREALLTL